MGRTIAQRPGTCVVCRKRYPKGTPIGPIYDHRGDGYGTKQWAHWARCVAGYAQTRQTQTRRTPVSIVLQYENQLGFDSVPAGEDSSRASHYRQVEAGKLTRAMATNPRRLTPDNLVKALQRLETERVRVERGPSVVLPATVLAYRIGLPDGRPAEPVDGPLELAMRAALEYEYAADEPDQDSMALLHRAHPFYRLHVLHEWRARGRGPEVLEGPLALLNAPPPELGDRDPTPL